MERFSPLIACSTYAAALLAGAYAHYCKLFDAWDCDAGPEVWISPTVRFGFWLVTAMGSLVGAAFFYQVARGFGGNPVDGWIAALLALWLRDLFSKHLAKTFFHPATGADFLADDA